MLFLLFFFADQMKYDVLELYFFFSYLAGSDRFVVNCKVFVFLDLIIQS